MIQLKQYANNTNNIFSIKAKTIYEKVRLALLRQRADMNFFFPVERKGSYEYKGPFTNDEIAERFHLQLPIGAINIVGAEKREMFVPDLVRVAYEHNDLEIVNRASIALKRIGGVEFFPWDLMPLSNWWVKNSINYTNWPYESYIHAHKLLASCKYK